MTGRKSSPARADADPRCPWPDPRADPTTRRAEANPWSDTNPKTHFAIVPTQTARVRRLAFASLDPRL